MKRLVFVFFILALLLPAQELHAQPFPSKPIKVVVPYPPGGVVDIIARVVGEHMSQRTNQPVIVENRPGAGTIIGTEAVARAPADGHTLVLASPAHTINISLYPELSWHPLQSFAPVVMVGMIPNVILVDASVPARTLADFVAYAKSRPGQLNYVSVPGSTIHLATEMFKQMANIDVVPIPYKAAPQGLAALRAGEVTLGMVGIGLAQPLLKSGHVRALAVTSARRSPAMPEVPTVAESGFPGLEVSTWYAYLAPAGTPQAIVAKLNSEVRAALANGAVAEKLARIGAEFSPGSPEELRTFLESDVERWAHVIRRGNIKLD